MMNVRQTLWFATLSAAAMAWTARGSVLTFDHEYKTYAQVLRRHLRPPLVDYTTLKADRALLDRAVAELSTPEVEEPSWSRERRIAFWINAYNVFTLRSIVDHYPIRNQLFSLAPRNSIRQIAGVWTEIKWNVAGRMLTLDDIEHRILRPEFGDARIHFAINCASIGCPPLAAEPYRPELLNQQLDAAARRYLNSSQGLRMADNTLYVSSIFKWYADDFVAQYSKSVPGDRDPRVRGILGMVARFGPAPIAVTVMRSSPAVRYLDYDWSLNDTGGRGPR